MALESKPLFHPEVLRQHVRAFSLPAHVAALQPRLNHWADLIASGQADDLKETALLPDFLTDFFCGVLGYARPTDGGGSFTLACEQHFEDDGQFADAVQPTRLEAPTGRNIPAQGSALGSRPHWIKP